MRKLKNSELERLTVEEFKQETKIPLIVILDDIRSLNNVGSVFRTCDAFLIEKIYLCGITATPPNKEIHKTALGSTESVAWEYADDVVGLIHQLKNDKVFVAAIEQTENSTMLNDFKIPAHQKLAIIFGNEVKGVKQSAVNLCDTAIEIPQFGTKHSLNISVSVGVVLWDLFKKMRFS